MGLYSRVAPASSGTGMTKVHTTDECLKIQDLNDTARVILALLTL